MPERSKAIAVAMFLASSATACSIAHAPVAAPTQPARLSIAEIGSDFVISGRADQPVGPAASPAAQLRLGSSVHLDRRLMTASPAQPSQEMINGPKD